MIINKSECTSRSFTSTCSCFMFQVFVRSGRPSSFHRWQWCSPPPLPVLSHNPLPCKRRTGILIYWDSCPNERSNAGDECAPDCCRSEQIEHWLFRCLGDARCMETWAAGRSATSILINGRGKGHSAGDWEDTQTEDIGCEHTCDLGDGKYSFTAGRVSEAQPSRQRSDSVRCAR
jgi:hypothetical protein